MPAMCPFYSTLIQLLNTIRLSFRTTIPALWIRPFFSRKQTTTTADPSLLSNSKMGNHCCTDKSVAVSTPAPKNANVLSDASTDHRASPVPPHVKNEKNNAAPSGKARTESPTKNDPGSQKPTQLSAPPTPAAAVAALQKEEETARALLISDESRQRASVVHDGADSLEWIAVALTNTFEPFQAELAKSAADKRTFDKKLGFVHEEFFHAFYNVYVFLTHVDSVTGEPGRGFLLGSGTCNAKHADYVLVKDEDVARMIERSSPSLKRRWADQTKTPLSVAKMLNELHMRPVWERKTVDFWEGHPPTLAKQQSGQSCVVPLLELPMSEVTLLNCKVSKSLAYPSTQQKKYVNEEVPVHALVFVSNGGEVKGCRKDIRFLHCDASDLAQAADGLSKDTMLVIYPCRASVFAERQLAERLKVFHPAEEAARVNMASTKK